MLNVKLITTQCIKNTKEQAYGTEIIKHKTLLTGEMKTYKTCE